MKTLATILVFICPLLLVLNIFGIVAVGGGTGLPAEQSRFIPKADLAGAIQSYHLALALLVLLPTLFCWGAWFLARKAKQESK